MDKKVFIVGVVTIVLSLIFIYIFYTPYWLTNDDAGMAMAVYGYGSCMQGNPNIVYSNIIWGHIVKYFPSFFDIQGYTWCQYIVIVLSVFLVFYCVNEYDNNIFICILLCVSMLFYACVLPAFTTTSGYSTLAASLCFITFLNKRKKGFIVLAFLFAFLGFLIRKEEFFLVCLCSLPMVPWKKFLASNISIFFSCSLVFLLILSSLINNKSYSGPEWQAFHHWNQVRTFLVDYGGASTLIEQEDIIKKFNYTKNDLYLLGNFFFVDASIADAEKIEMMKSNIKLDKIIKGSYDNGIKSIKTFRDGVLGIMTIIFFLILTKKINYKLIIALLLVIATFFFIGFMGRPSQERIYYPVSFLLISFALISKKTDILDRYIWIDGNVLTFCLFLLFIFSISRFSHVNHAYQRKDFDFIKEDVAIMQDEDIIVFAASFPVEIMYKPFSKISDIDKFSFQWLSAGSFHPYARNYFNIEDRNGFSNYFKNGFKIVCGDGFRSLLETYCSEHLNGDMNYSILKSNYLYKIFDMRCVPRD